MKKLLILLGFLFVAWLFYVTYVIYACFPRYEIAHSVDPSNEKSLCVFRLNKVTGKTEIWSTVAVPSTWQTIEKGE